MLRSTERPRRRLASSWLYRPRPAAGAIGPAGGRPSGWGHALNPRIRPDRSACREHLVRVLQRAWRLVAEWLSVPGMADCNCGGEPPAHRSVGFRSRLSTANTARSVAAARD